MGRVNPAGIVVSILLVFALVGLGLCLIVNEWYYYEVDLAAEGTLVETRTSFGLIDGTVELTVENETIMGAMEYVDENGTQTATGEMFDTVFMMMLLGIILTLAFIVMGFLAGFSVVPGWSTLLVGMIAAGVVFAAPIYLWSLTPDAWEEEMTADGSDEPEGDGPWSSFMGTGDETYEDGTTITSDWGPSWAFYTAMVIGVFIMIMSFIFGGMKKHVKKDDRPRDYDRYDDDYDRRRPPPRRGYDDYDQRPPPRRRYDDRDDHDRRPPPRRRDRDDDYDHDRRRPPPPRKERERLGPLGPVIEEEKEEEKEEPKREGRYGKGGRDDYYERDRRDYRPPRDERRSR